MEDLLQSGSGVNAVDSGGRLRCTSLRHKDVVILFARKSLTAYCSAGLLWASRTDCQIGFTALNKTNREEVCGAAAVGFKCKITGLDFIRQRIGDESYFGTIIDDTARKPRIY